MARFGLGDLVDFRYEVAVGDEALDPAELAELARLKVPLVRLRGQWVELEALPRLDAMASQTYEIVALAQRAGPTRLHVELSADQLESGPVIDEAGSTVFED